MVTAVAERLLLAAVLGCALGAGMGLAQAEREGRLDRAVERVMGEAAEARCPYSVEVKSPSTGEVVEWVCRGTAGQCECRPPTRMGVRS